MTRLTRPYHRPPTVLLAHLDEVPYCLCIVPSEPFSNLFNHTYYTRVTTVIAGITAQEENIVSPPRWRKHLIIRLISLLSA